MKNVASIDIGSNSVVLSICRKEQGYRRFFIKVISLSSVKIKSNNVFEKESFESTLDAIEDYKLNIEKNKVATEDIIIITTEHTSKRAENRNELFDKIFQRSWGTR